MRLGQAGKSSFGPRYVSNWGLRVFRCLVRSVLRVCVDLGSMGPLGAGLELRGFGTRGLERF